MAVALAGHLFPGWRLWLALALLAAVNVVWIGLSDRISADAGWLMTSWPLAFAGAWWLFRRQAQGREPDVLTAAIKLMMLLSFAGTCLGACRMFNHLANTTALPVVDAYLQEFDRLLGFNWLDYSVWLSGQEGLTRLMLVAYEMIYGVVLLIASVHVLRGDDNRVGEVAGLLVFSAMACSAIGALVPAWGAMKMLGTPELAAALPEGAGTYMVRGFASVRSTGLVHLTSMNLPGLTAVPSYHTTLGLLCVYFSRGHWVSLTAASAYAAFMIASTPVFGGHYLADILAGGAFTVACIMLWRMAGSATRRQCLRQALSVPSHPDPVGAFIRAT